MNLRDSTGRDAGLCRPGAFLVVLAAALGLSSLRPAPAQDPAVAGSATPAPGGAPVNSIDPDALRASVSFLASDELEGRDTPSPGLDKAADWLGARFEEAKLRPAFEGGWYQGPLADGAPAEGPKRFAMRNVGALLGGRDPELRQETVVVSAHYDHIGRGRRRGPDRAAEAGADDIHNGADDDASGTAAVLQIARALAAGPAPPRRTVLFLCFYGEEKGFLGSKFYCGQPARPLAHTIAVFNLEMLGRPEQIAKKEAWITGFELSDFGEIVARSGAAAGIRFYGHPRFSKMLFAASDNIEFAKRGVPAFSFSAGSLHDDYHKPSDEAAKLDYENMAAVTGGLLAAVRSLAEDGPRPTWKPGSRYADRARELRGGK